MSATPPISTKRTTGYHLKPLNQSLGSGLSQARICDGVRHVK